MVVIALAADIALVYALVADRASWRWWSALLVVVLGGAVLGWWGQFHCPYDLGNGRVGYGVPLTPAIETTREGEGAGIEEPPLPGFFMLLNLLIIALVAPVPLSASYFVWREVTEARAPRRGRPCGMPG
jgi:hypothetical protein